MTAIPKAKKRKKSERKRLIDECDRLFSLWVRSVGMCESPRLEHTPDLQCAHGFSRSYKAVRWDRRQAWSLCRGCHVYYTFHPIEWDAFMRSQMGEALYEEVRVLALTHQEPDLHELLTKLRVEVST